MGPLWPQNTLGMVSIHSYFLARLWPVMQLMHAVPEALEMDAYSAVLECSINANQMFLSNGAGDFFHHLSDFPSNCFITYGEKAEISSLIVDLFLLSV